MKDAIGQEINVGDKVAYTGGKYAQMTLFAVEKITPKKVTVFVSRGLGPERVFLWPQHLIVVTNNLRVLTGNAEVIDTGELESLRSDSDELIQLLAGEDL